MAENESPYKLLNTFSGLIYRQPVFDTDKLDVDSYHLTFLDIHGQRLNEDSPVPEFITQIDEILPEINPRQKAMLTIPESWRHEILSMDNHQLSLILDLNGDVTPSTPNSKCDFASEPSNSSVVNFASTFLVDLEKFKPVSLLHHLPDWQKANKTLCAVNVNATEQYQFCKTNELQLAQGYFYALPETRENQGLKPSQQTLMELLVKLQDPDAEPEHLADIINQDVALNYKLLKLINSAFFGLPKEVASSKQAVMMLGMNKVKTWASLLCLSGMDDKPNELRTLAMTRARMCELLAKYYKGQPDAFFTVGLLSTLDAMMDKSIDKIIENLPLAPEMLKALIEREGGAGNALTDVINYERGHWNLVTDSAIPAEIMVRAYLDAVQWSKELNQQLTD